MCRPSSFRLCHDHCGSDLLLSYITESRTLGNVRCKQTRWRRPSRRESSAGSFNKIYFFQSLTSNSLHLVFIDSQTFFWKFTVSNGNVNVHCHITISFVVQSLWAGRTLTNESLWCVVLILPLFPCETAVMRCCVI